MTLKQLPKKRNSFAVIRFQDCDPYGHLNNSKYFDYFINAREDQIQENYHLDLHGLAKTKKIGWVVFQSQITHLTPANLMDQVQIWTQLIHHTPKSLLIEYQMYDHEKTHLKSVLWTKFVHVDLVTQKARDHSEEHMHLFQSVHEPVDQAEFHNRVRYLVSSPSRS